jgi:ubiquinone biosynthesis monooxygenase Coq7
MMAGIFYPAEPVSGMRKFNLIDKALMQVDQALRTSYGHAHAERENPARGIEDGELGGEDEQRSAGLMRINHSGEVCAQALYFGQALSAQDAAVNGQMMQAANEETDHLAWCHERLLELNSNSSVLNPLWYLGSFTIGAVAGAAGDRWSLGFVSETERQVEAHLEGHLETLPEGDLRSRAIIEVMTKDEARHAQNARLAGGAELPEPIKRLMASTAGLMKWLAYRV